MVFDLEKVKSLIPHQFPKSNIVFIPGSCNSTMDTAKERLTDGLDCTVVIAESQSKGRGSYNRIWISSSTDNLYFTVGLSSVPAPALQSSTFLSDWLKPIRLAVGVAMCHTLNKLSVQNVFLKWPNDIIISGKKVCGILLEVYPLPSKKWGCSIGVGLNVNCDTSAFSEKLSCCALQPISLWEATGRYFSKEEVLALFLIDFWDLIIPYNVHLNPQQVTIPYSLSDSHFQSLLEDYSKLNAVIGKHIIVYPKSMFPRVLFFRTSPFSLFLFSYYSLVIIQTIHLKQSELGLLLMAN